MHHPEGNENPGGPKATKLDEAAVARARQGFLTSGTKQGAALAVGVHRGTLDIWLQQGRADRAAAAEDEPADTLHARLLDALESAKDELIHELGAQVQARAIADGDTRTMLRLLAVLDPDTWSVRSEHRHAGVAGAPPIATSVTGPPPTQVVRITFDDGLAAEAAAIAAGDED